MAEEEVKVIEFDFTNSRGQKLHCYKLLPPAGVKVSAIALWLHGLCTHTGRQLKGWLVLLLCSV